jgi:hypothetical protein
VRIPPAAHPEDAYPLSLFQPVGFPPARKYQFFTRSESVPKYWVSNTRSPRINLGFFNRYKPQVGPTSQSQVGCMEGRNQGQVTTRSQDCCGADWAAPSNNAIIDVMGEVCHRTRIGNIHHRPRFTRLNNPNRLPAQALSMTTPSCPVHLSIIFPAWIV